METGLKPLPYDARDFDLHKTFGIATAPTTFPDNYNVDLGVWAPDQNQENHNFIPAIPALPYGCTDYAQADVCADEDGELHNPMLLEAVTHANALGGIDMRTALNAAKQVFNRTAYFRITPTYPLDFFDAIRLAMYATQDERRGVSVGTPFYHEWMTPLDQAILPTPTSFSTAGLGWHNWKIAGWKTIDSKPYLKGKMWCGPNYGDRGFVYLSRELFNAVMKIDGTAAFTLTKVTPSDVQTINFNLIKWLVAFFSDLFKAPLPANPTPMPTTPPTIPPAPPISKIPTWALTIETREGGRPTDLNITQHNPGNLKYTTYTASLGASKGIKGSDGGYFCHFPTRDAGLQALQQFLTDACNGKLLSYKPTDTILKFTKTYANPPTDDYAKAVATACGVSVSTPIKELL